MPTNMQDEITKAMADELGVSDMSVEEQQSIIGQFGEVALKAAMLAITEKLSPEERDKFSKLAETGDATAIRAFLDSKVPEHENIAKTAVAEELARFKAFQAESAA